MALRLIKTIGDVKTYGAKIYRDTEWQEYRTQFYVNGKHRKAADSHTDDKDDAIGTAEWQVNAYIEKAKKPAAKKPAAKKSTKPHSAVQLLKDLEKPRGKNPRGRVAKKNYIALKIRAPNDTNGNGRKGFIIWHDSGKFVDFIDIGYMSDNQALKKYSDTHNVIDLGLIDVTAGVFNQAKKHGLYA